MTKAADLIPDWQRALDAIREQIGFFEEGPGLSPAIPIATLCMWAAEYEDLISHYGSFGG